MDRRSCPPDQAGRVLPGSGSDFCASPDQKGSMRVGQGRPLMACQGPPLLRPHLSLSYQDAVPEGQSGLYQPAGSRSRRRHRLRPGARPLALRQAVGAAGQTSEQTAETEAAKTIAFIEFAVRLPRHPQYPIAMPPKAPRVLCSFATWGCCRNSNGAKSAPQICCSSPARARTRLSSQFCPRRNFQGQAMTYRQIDTVGDDGEASKQPARWGLVFGSIGVVFGDIGTSPLYALREALSHAADGEAVSRTDVLGVVSLLIWPLIVIVTFKYVFLLLMSDNKGEGGILSLVTLVEHALGRRGGFALLLGIVGAAFFFGDAMITPAISVLSAVEGLEVINPGFESYVVPLTLVVLR